MKFSWVLLFCMAMLIVGQVNCAHILVISFFSSKSHKMTYQPLVEALSKNGHTIKLVSPIKPMKEMKNVEEVYTFDVEKLFQGDKFDPFEVKEKGQKFNPITFLKIFQETCEKSFALSQVQDLLKEKFDLVILQPMFNDCILGLIYRLQAPFVLFTPTIVPAYLAEALGGNFPSSVYPNVVLGYDQEMTFPQRFISFGVNSLLLAFRKVIYEPKMESIYRNFLGADIPSIAEIYTNASLLLSNGHFSLTGPLPYSSDIIDVGGLHCRPAKPIPKDLEDFISKGRDGFVLFSLGSAIKGDMMPEAKRKLILNVFSKFKNVQFLWKWESESMTGVPENVKLSKWLPQQDLLGHKAIKMFITHCGGGSTEEAIYHGVPLLGIPMFADQPKNAALAKKKGFLVELDWNKLTEEDLEEAINEILNNSTYRDNVKRLSTLFNDRPNDPLELAVYWIEYVLRHKGASHLRSAGRKLNTFQYHSIDVMAAYLILFSIILYLIFALSKLICRLVLCRGQRKQLPVANGKKTK